MASPGLRSTTARDLVLCAAGILVALLGLLALSRAGLRPQLAVPETAPIPFPLVHYREVIDRMLPDDYKRVALEPVPHGRRRVYELRTEHAVRTIEIFEGAGPIYAIVGSFRNMTGESMDREIRDFMVTVATLALSFDWRTKIVAWIDEHSSDQDAETTIGGIHLHVSRDEDERHVLRVTSTSAEPVPN